MPGELGSIVESDGAPEGFGQVGQHVRQMACGSWGLSILWPVDDRDREARSWATRMAWP